MAHEGVPLVVIQRQLGHANLGITSVYLQGIDSAEIIDTVHGRPSPMISATPGLDHSVIRMGGGSPAPFEWTRRDILAWRRAGALPI
jgi:hypothetical protein